MKQRAKSEIGVFQKYLTLWVLLCMTVGILVGYLIPDISKFLSSLEIASVNIPIAILIWLMIFPMMLKVDFASVKEIRRQPKGLFLTWIVNWLIKPFTMFAIASLFFYWVFRAFIPPHLAQDYLAGAVLLGAAPCTAMVFVWSGLTRGNAAYTLVQVATNDLIILLLFVPIVALLLGIGGFVIPWGTLILSVSLFVVVPLVLATITRLIVVKVKSVTYLETKVLPKFNPLSTIGLLLMLVLLFIMQASLIVSSPLHIIFIAVPLILQTVIIFGLAYSGARMLKLPFEIAAPAGFIGASNFFELSVAVAISLFPLNPAVSLATVVGVLVEVPVMLMLVKFANATKGWFKPMRVERNNLDNSGNEIIVAAEVLQSSTIIGGELDE